MKPRLGSLLSLGSIAVVFVIGSVYLTFGIVGVRWSEHYTTATMELPDAVSLVPRSPVLLSGVKVGEVTAVTTTPAGVDVDFRIEDGYRIPADSVITLEQLSALGELYIEFRPRTTGGGPYLTDGARVRAEQVRLPVSIPDMAHTITTLLEQFDPQAISSIIATFSQAIAGTDALIPELARASNLLAATLLSRAPQIRALLDNAQVPGPDVARAGANMAAAGPEWGEFGVKVREVVDSLERLLNARPVPEAYSTGTGLLPFLSEVTTYIDQIGPDLQQLFPVVQPLLNNAAGSLPGIDLSALIEQALRGTSPDGALQLQINLK
ncbi:MCE family protein [Nocardia uniformis]|uniref:MCE family protein n=1 Tax=Nocardia uniformis TaxID=53432 RepID=A0A849C8T6_9NOCA|nr:MlaD family protein [Nocardia uniformis]NNH72780.1 MCE family protein [Nocardia uniformis]